MKIFYLLLPLSIINCSASYSQQLTPLTIGLGKPLETKNANGVSGTPYLLDKFQNSQVITPAGRTLENVQLRYDVLAQSVECLVDNQVYDVTDSVAKFSFTDSLMQVNKFVKLKPPGATKTNSFYKILSPGKFSLVKGYTETIASDQDWYTKQTIKKYKKNEELYLLANGKLSKLGTNKKSLLAAFNNDPAVKARLDSQTVDLKNESSLIDFFKGFN